MTQQTNLSRFFGEVPGKKNDLHRKQKQQSSLNSFVHKNKDDKDPCTPGPTNDILESCPAPQSRSTSLPNDNETDTKIPRHPTLTTTKHSREDDLIDTTDDDNYSIEENENSISKKKLKIEDSDVRKCQYHSPLTSDSSVDFQGDKDKGWRRILEDDDMADLEYLRGVRKRGKKEEELEAVNKHDDVVIQSPKRKTKDKKLTSKTKTKTKNTSSNPSSSCGQEEKNDLKEEELETVNKDDDIVIQSPKNKTKVKKLTSKTKTKMKTKNTSSSDLEKCREDETNDLKEEELETVNKDDDFVIQSPKNKTKGKKLTSNTKTKTKTKNTSSNPSSSCLSDEKLLSEYDKDSTNIKWNTGNPIPYATLCKVFSEIETITSRLDIQRIMTDMFRLALLKYSNDLLALVYVASNSVAAAYECVELGVGDSILIKAIGEASGSKTATIKQTYEAKGDLGTVASSAKGKQKMLVGFGSKPKPLTIQEVLTVFRQIATTSGNQSQKWKVDKIKGLLVRAQEGTVAKYIIRGLQGKLRIGLAQSTVLISLAHAVTLSSPFPTAMAKKTTKEAHDCKEKDDSSTAVKDETEKISSDDATNATNLKLPIETRLECAVNIVKKAYSQTSSYDTLVKALLSCPLERLGEECSLRPGMPVEPMLAKPTKSIQEVLKRLSGKRFTCEFKYDGERAQVHMSSDGAMKVFSRSLLDTSEKFPEVPLYVKESCAEMGIDSFVLDTEVVAYNRETKQFVPFQVLSTRKKTTEGEEDAKVKVIVQAFDIMFINGKSVLDNTLEVRRQFLRKHFKPVDGKFQFATSLDFKDDGDTTVIEEFLGSAIKGQCEGLMIKTLDENATYQPSNRSLNWLKLKKDYLDGMGDSFDLVPIGAFYGRGKRTGSYGAYLLACYDQDTEEFQSVCKVGTGFSDEDLKTLCEGLKDHIIPVMSSQYNVSDSLKCDSWFAACQVWEVKAADLSKSSTHKGAIGKTGEVGRGIGLRFPRFERLRDDKKPEQATSSDQILEMYYAQDSVVEDGNEGFGDEGI